MGFGQQALLNKLRICLREGCDMGDEGEKRYSAENNEGEEGNGEIDAPQPRRSSNQEKPRVSLEIPKQSQKRENEGERRMTSKGFQIDADDIDRGGRRPSKGIQSDPEDIDRYGKRPSKGFQYPDPDSRGQSMRDTLPPEPKRRSTLSDKRGDDDVDNIMPGSGSDKRSSRGSAPQTPEMSDNKSDRGSAQRNSSIRGSASKPPSVQQGSMRQQPQDNTDGCVCTCSLAEREVTRPQSEEQPINDVDLAIYVGVLKVTSRAVTFTIYSCTDFSVILSESDSLQTVSPKTGWFQQSATDLMTLCYQTMNRASYKLMKKDSNALQNIKALGITNQADAVVVWHSDTQEPLYDVILGKDGRCIDQLNDFYKECGSASCLANETGMSLTISAAALKIRWLIENVTEAQEAYLTGKLKAGTLDSWIIWNLTNGRLHITDHTNAARTMLFNIKTMGWDENLLEKFQLRYSILPQVRSSSEVFGEVTNTNCGLKDLNISAIICVPNSVMIGTCSLQPGNAVYCSEPGCNQVMINAGRNYVSSKDHNTTIAYKIGPESTANYSLETQVSPIERSSRGRSMIGSVTFSFMRRNIESVSDSTNNDVAVATDQVTSALNKSANVTGTSVNQLYVIGALADNSHFLQSEANHIQANVMKAKSDDAASLGAALLAAHGSNYFAMTNDALEKILADDLVFSPSQDAAGPIQHTDSDENTQQPSQQREGSMASQRSPGPGSNAASVRSGPGSYGVPLSGSGGDGMGGGDGGGGGGFPIRLEDIDLQTGIILALIALALIFIGYLIGRSGSTTVQETIVLRKCPRR